jgi:small subunit ribosomal protein S3Ae
MTLGKNKRLGKKKGSKKKIVDPFSRKDWYTVRAPQVFPKSTLGLTPVTKSSGQRNCLDFLRGRVFEISLGDLKDKAEDDAFRKFKLRVEDIQGHACLTNFWGMDITRDKFISIIRKWYSLIECHVDVKTVDGFSLRVFVVGFTKRRPNQTSKACYAQSSQMRQIRKKMVEVVNRETANMELKDIVSKLVVEVIGKEVEKACQGIFPLTNVLVRKVKVTHAPKLDVSKLMEIHGGAAAVAELGQRLERPVEEPKPDEPKPGEPAMEAAAAPVAEPTKEAAVTAQ